MDRPNGGSTSSNSQKYLEERRAKFIESLSSHYLLGSPPPLPSTRSQPTSKTQTEPRPRTQRPRDTLLNADFSEHTKKLGKRQRMIGFVIKLTP